MIFVYLGYSINSKGFLFIFSCSNRYLKKEFNEEEQHKEEEIMKKIALLMAAAVCMLSCGNKQTQTSEQETEPQGRGNLPRAAEGLHGGF